MQQSLENVISKLQKTYQLKTLELEQLKEELELRKIATALANFKDHDEIATYDQEKIKTFLLKSESKLDIDMVSLSCTIVDLANAVVKESKRYMDASKILAEIKKEAVSYIEEKDDLFLKQTQCENLLQTMEDLFYTLTNKVVVDAEKMDIYIKLLENEIFKEDKYAVLVVVAALVIRNANLLVNPSKITNKDTNQEEIKYTLNKRQEDKRKSYAAFVQKEEEMYNSKHRGMITNTYLKNIELLIEKEKISFEEAKTMLNSDSNLYEYFLWNWMNKLVVKLENATSTKDANNIISQLDKLKERYDELLERKKISNLVKSKVKNTRTLLYLKNDGSKNVYFNVDEVTKETTELIQQLKEGKDTKKVANILCIDNDLNLLTSEQEFVLFKRLPKNNTLVILNGKIEEMDKKLDTKMLTKLSNFSYFNTISKIVTENSVEYRKLLQESEKIESKIMKKVA